MHMHDIVSLYKHIDVELILFLLHSCQSFFFFVDIEILKLKAMFYFRKY